MMVLPYPLNNLPSLNGFGSKVATSRLPRDMHFLVSPLYYS